MHKGNRRCGLKLCLSSLLSIFLVRAFAAADDFSQGESLPFIIYFGKKIYCHVLLRWKAELFQPCIQVYLLITLQIYFSPGSEIYPKKVPLKLFRQLSFEICQRN